MRGREKPQRCLEELATVSPPRGQVTSALPAAAGAGRPRVSGQRMTLNMQSPRQLHQLRHRQQTSLSNDFFPEPDIVQIELWESRNAMENLRKQPFLLRWVLNFAFFQRENLGYNGRENFFSAFIFLVRRNNSHSNYKIRYTMKSKKYRGKIVAQNLPGPIPFSSEFTLPLSLIFLGCDRSRTLAILQLWILCTKKKKKPFPGCFSSPPPSAVSLPLSPLCLFVVNVRAVSVTV